jgi:cytidine deaminase
MRRLPGDACAAVHTRQMHERQIDRLRAAAHEARQMHWAPYSRYMVLAAVETADGRLYGGSNVEAANLTLTKHAEEVALLCALADGATSRLGRQWLKTVYVTAGQLSPPCGGCRQMLWEFADPDCLVICDTMDGDHSPLVMALTQLLPHPFGPENFGL